MAATTTKQRRSRGDGAAYQRCETSRGCPPVEIQPDGSKARPKHKCRGRWTAVLDLGYSAGKRRRKVIYGASKSDVLAKLRKARGELDRRGDMPTSSPTLAAWLDTWLDEIASQKIKPGTLRSYRTYCREYLVPSIGRKKLDKLTAADVRAVHRFILDKGLSSTTALNAHRVLSAALRAAVREDKLSRNVASADFVDAPRKDQSGREGLDVDQAKAVLRAAQGDRLASRWIWALFTGSRQGEALALRWQDVDIENGTADLSGSLTAVPWSHGCGQDKPDHRADHCRSRHLQIPAGMEHEVLHGNLVRMAPKTKGSTRVVPLAEPLRKALEARKLAADVERDEYTRDHDLVFCRPDGAPIEPRKDWQAWRDLLDAAEVPAVTLHETRNTAISILHEAGVPDTVIMAIVGHTTVTMTRAYQRQDVTMARSAVDRLADVLALD